MNKEEIERTHMKIDGCCTKIIVSSGLWGFIRHNCWTPDLNWGFPLDRIDDGMNREFLFD